VTATGFRQGKILSARRRLGDGCRGDDLASPRNEAPRPQARTCPCRSHAHRTIRNTKVFESPLKVSAANDRHQRPARAPGRTQTIMKQQQQPSSPGNPNE